MNTSSNIARAIPIFTFGSAAGAGMALSTIAVTAIAGRKTLASFLPPKAIVIIEVEGADEQYYDQLQLLKSVSQRVDLRAEELCRQLVAEVRKFAASKDFEDDVCLIAMEVDHLMKG